MELAFRAKTILTEKHHGKVFELTRKANSNWRDIGRKLGFEFEQLESIAQDQQNTTERYYVLLMRWLKQMPLSSTNAECLAQVLREVHEENLAKSFLEAMKKEIIV